MNETTIRWVLILLIVNFFATFIGFWMIMPQIDNIPKWECETVVSKRILQIRWDKNQFFSPYVLKHNETVDWCDDSVFELYGNLYVDYEGFGHCVIKTTKEVCMVK